MCNIRVSEAQFDWIDKLCRWNRVPCDVSPDTLCKCAASDLIDALKVKLSEKVSSKIEQPVSKNSLSKLVPKPKPLQIPPPAHANRDDDILLNMAIKLVFQKITPQEMILDDFQVHFIEAVRRAYVLFKHAKAQIPL